MSINAELAEEPRTGLVAAVNLMLGNGMLYLRRSKSNVREGGKWNIPSGGIHEGENKILAALREVREETGAVFRPEGIAYLGKAPVPIHLADGSETRAMCYTFVIDAREELLLKDIRLLRKEHTAKMTLSFGQLTYQRYLIARDNNLKDRMVDVFERKVLDRHPIDFTTADKVNIVMNYDKLREVVRRGMSAVPNDHDYELVELSEENEGVIRSMQAGQG